MPEKFNELLLKQDIIELYNGGITPDYGYLLNGRFEKDMIKTLYPLKTLSGNPISWEASDTEYLFPVVSLEPKQAGSGDPSPENVRPITGWDNVRVHQRGLNLLDFSKIAFNPFDVAVGNVSVDYVQQTITIAPNINNVGYYQTLRDIVGKDLPPGTYVIDAETSSANVERLIYILDTGRAATFGTPTLFSDADLNSKFSWYNRAGNPEPNTISNIRFCMAPSPYAPYQGNDYTLTLPKTIYGGTVDAVTGVGEKTWGYIASYNGESLPGEWISDRDVYTSGTTPTTGAQVAYKLATPEPFQATGNQALTIQAGNHTIYTDGNNISLSRKARRLEV